MNKLSRRSDPLQLRTEFDPVLNSIQERVWRSILSTSRPESPDAKNLDAKNLDAKNLDAKNLDAKNLDAKNLDAKNLDAKQTAGDVSPCRSLCGERELPAQPATGLAVSRCFPAGSCRQVDDGVKLFFWSPTLLASNFL